MPKKICFLYTETNGLHKSNEHVTKKKLYNYARLVVLNYEIGYLENNMFIIEKEVRRIIKPNCMYIPNETILFHGITNEKAFNEGYDIEEVILKFIKDLKNVDIIVSHNIDFHLKTVLSEIVRYNLIINKDFNKFIIIDTISFYHEFGLIKLKELGKKLKIKNINLTKIELIRTIFFKLYDKFNKSN
jgi:DNA polymerase-3 subunit alpha